MELDLITKDPILVKNPYTGRFINIAPLFDAMHQFDNEAPDSIAELRKAITRTIRFINLNTDPSSSLTATSVPDLHYDLYRLEDMFDSMSEFR